MRAARVIPFWNLENVCADACMPVSCADEGGTILIIEIPRLEEDYSLGRPGAAALSRCDSGGSNDVDPGFTRSSGSIYRAANLHLLQPMYQA